MELSELKLQTLGIDKAVFGPIFAFVDFGNVNYWYHKDRVGPDAAPLSEGQRLIVDLEKLGTFLHTLAEQCRFYYGWDPRLPRSQHLVVKAGNNGFIKNTKPIQYIKQYITDDERNETLRILRDSFGKEYIEIPKCNFDVEITIDALRLVESYQTFCLLSGDSDFARLAQFLKQRGKKIIVIASGQVYHTLKESADLYINAQQVKSSIVTIKEAAPLAGRGLDIGSASGGQDGDTAISQS